MRLIAGKDVQIESAQSTYAQSQSSSHKQAGIGAEVRASLSGSVAAGITISGSTSSSRSHEAGTHHENVRIASGTDVTIISGEDTTIAGAQIKAPAVDVKTGRNLTIASRQDTTVGASRSRHASASGMLGVVGTSSFNASVGAGEGSTDRAWVEEQTSLTGDHVAIDTTGHTQLDGALIAANDNAQTLSTGTLGHSDIVDHDERHHKQATVGFSTANTGNVLKGGSISGEISNLTREQITRATVGEGEIVVREGKADIATLNRDITRAQEITRDEASGVSFYASTSAIEEAASGFEGIRGNVDEFGKAVQQGFRHIPQRIQQSVDEAAYGLNLLGQTFDDAVATLLGHQVAKGDITQAQADQALNLSKRLNNPEVIAAINNCVGGGKLGFSLHDIIFTRAHAASALCTVPGGQVIETALAQRLLATAGKALSTAGLAATAVAGGILLVGTSSLNGISTIETTDKFGSKLTIHKDDGAGLVLVTAVPPGGDIGVKYRYELVNVGESQFAIAGGSMIGANGVSAPLSDFELSTIYINNIEPLAAAGLVLYNKKNPDHGYFPKPQSINGFPDLQKADAKTPVKGRGNLRPRWRDSDGNIYEWDRQHGALEKYNKRGKHLGEFDPDTGKQTKPADKTRKVEP